MKRLALLLLLALTACGPMTVQQAERQCFDRARLAQQPRGSLSFGVGSNGAKAAELELNVSSDYLMGKDPSAVYDSCVMSKSGQPPTRPLYARPDWKG